MVKIRKDKNGNGYFYLVKYYNCLSEKHSEKKKSLVNLTYTCSRIIRTYRRLTSCAFISAITLKPLPKQKIRFFQLYWFSYHKTSFRNMTFRYLQTSETSQQAITISTAILDTRLVFMPSYRGLPEWSANILCCFDNFVLCFGNFVLCFDNFVLCFDNFVLCFGDFVLCFDNFVLCFDNLCVVFR